MHSARFDWVGPGTVIAGRYRVEALLGEGGYGAVYVAVQANLERKVALKLLHAEVLSKGRARERFEREGRLTQQLSHPNVVRLFDFGMTEHGMPYMVCELLEGRSVEDEIKRVGGMSPARVIHIGQQMLKGLAEAHHRGIIHRDIKPANVFLCDYAGEPDFVKILDFGIAAGPTGDKTAGLTQEGVSLGTPAYMSPEQVLDEPLDGRSDLYAVGLVLAEMLQGVAVYRGTGAMEVALQQITETVVPLSPLVAQGPLGHVIMRATRKDRDQRFGSALEMLDALRQLSAIAGPSPAFIEPRFGSGPYAPGAPMPGMPMHSHSQPVPPPPFQFVQTSFPSGSAVSVAMASPQAAQAKKPRSTALIAAAVGASLVACVVLGAALTMFLTSPAPKKTTGEPTAVAKVADKAPERDPLDPEEMMDRVVQQQMSNMFRDMMGNPGGGSLPMSCKPLPPAAMAFAVEGLTLPLAVQRFEAAGYECHALLSLGPDLGTMSFSNKAGVSFSLFYGGGRQIDPLRTSPGASHVTDVKTNRSLIVVPGDSNAATGTRLANVMTGRPP